MIAGVPNTETNLDMSLAQKFDPTLYIGKVQCCSVDLTSCTRSIDSKTCINDINSNWNYFDAEAVCKNLEPIGMWDLCPKYLIESKNPELCEEQGCDLNEEFIWLKREINAGRVQNFFKYLSH